MEKIENSQGVKGISPPGCSFLLVFPTEIFLLNSNLSEDDKKDLLRDAVQFLSDFPTWIFPFDEWESGNPPTSQVHSRCFCYNYLWMRKLIVIVSLIFLAAVAGGYVFLIGNNKIISPLGSRLIEKPLDKYTFARLKETKFSESPITFGKMIKDGNTFMSYVFYFNIEGKKASGLANIPKNQGTYPIIVMFRGYVPKEKYSIGEGTKRAGEVFAQNGFITLAPDFLGYGESASPSASSIEERFQTYATALTLLASVESINNSLQRNEFNARADTGKIGIWGHSNGGHIALSVLEITGKNYPTVLWAPVSKPFPYSILYYTDEFDDRGKMLRKVLSEFEKDYDAELYSPLNYYSWIQAPIQLHQGSADEAVPQKWSDELVESLEKLEKEVDYFIYPGDDHNLQPNGWSLAVEKSIGFYKSKFE